MSLSSFFGEKPREKDVKVASLQWIYWSGCCYIKIEFNQENIIPQSSRLAFFFLHENRFFFRLQCDRAQTEVFVYHNLQAQIEAFMQMIYTFSHIFASIRVLSFTLFLLQLFKLNCNCFPPSHGKSVFCAICPGSGLSLASNGFLL